MSNWKSYEYVKNVLITFDCVVEITQWDQWNKSYQTIYIIALLSALRFHRNYRTRRGKWLAGGEHEASLVGRQQQGIPKYYQ